MFNQVKQSLLASDEVSAKLGKTILTTETSQFCLIIGVYLLFSPATTAPGQQQLDQEERLAEIKELSESFCLLIEKVKTLTLTMEEIINLEKNTQYKEDEIKEWFRFIANIETGPEASSSSS